jgi:hypothetical protein
MKIKSLAQATEISPQIATIKDRANQNYIMQYTTTKPK